MHRKIGSDVYGAAVTSTGAKRTERWHGGYYAYLLLFAVRELAPGHSKIGTDVYGAAVTSTEAKRTESGRGANILSIGFQGAWAGLPAHASYKTYSE